MAETNMYYSRVHISLVNSNKVQAIYDFAFGDYLAYKNFFNELNRIQTALINEGEVELETGHVARLDSVGGMLAIQLYLETIEATKTTMAGLSKLGLKNENKLLTSMM